jgi:hypothetical protein
MTQRIIVTAIWLFSRVPSALAVDFRMEISPNLSIPVAPFIDGVIISELSVQPNTGIAEIASFSDFEHSVGVGVGIGFLFENFDTRYELM